MARIFLTTLAPALLKYNNAEPVDWHALCCNNLGPGSWWCTREVGHDGDHIAHQIQTREVLARWARV